MLLAERCAESCSQKFSGLLIERNDNENASGKSDADACSCLTQSPSNANSKIEIHGLVGFATSSSSNQNPIAVVPASADSTNGIFVDDLAAWNRDKGLLAFSIRNNQRLVAGTEYAFQVSLFNPSTPQASPPISITAIGDTDVPMMLMQKAAGQAAPLFVSSPQLVMATVRFPALCSPLTRCMSRRWSHLYDSVLLFLCMNPCLLPYMGGALPV